MDTHNTLTRLIGIDFPWRLIDIQANGERSLVLRVKYDKESAPCPECRRDVRVTGSVDERWRWLGSTATAIFVNGSLPLATCTAHGEFPVGAAWQLNCEARNPRRLTVWLLARHLEVFVPKPRKRKQEEQLLAFLDDLVRKPELPLRSRNRQELAGFPKRARSLLTTHESWENIIFGYSTYVTDGAFLDVTSYPKQPGECLKEQTLVLKFILTNYRTDFDGSGCSRFFSLAEIMRKQQSSMDKDRLTELLCAEAHYSDICDFIVAHVADRVLGDETEVWSQEWLTVLNRLKLLRYKDQVASCQQDKTDRHLGPNVLCTFEYCAPHKAALKGRQRDE